MQMDKVEYFISYNMIAFYIQRVYLIDSEFDYD